MKLIRFFAAAFVLAATQLAAKEAAPLADDPQIEARLNGLAQDLRCLVCQNQSLADSHAPLAEDLRRQIREQMKAGKSDAEVTDFLVERYGDFVLYKPPLKSTTLLLWGGPFALLVVALLAFAIIVRRRSRMSEESASPEARARAKKLLDSSD